MWRPSHCAGRLLGAPASLSELLLLLLLLLLLVVVVC
jgi:hypothetical protein